MRLQTSLRRLLGLAVAGLAVITPTPALAHDGGGAVFTETNASANAVQVYTQASDGSLAAGASYATGGTGTGATGLGSQGALALEHGWLLAVNAGSNDVSAFRVRGGHLALVNRVSSGGTTPNSVTIRDGVAYVLNAGGTGNISGFRLSRHGLVPLSGGTQPLSFHGGGRRAGLLHAERRSARRLGEGRQYDRHLSRWTDWGRAGPRAAARLGRSGALGFAFGKHDSLLVTEAAASALSSYQLDPFTTITASLLNGQGAACWAASTRNGPPRLHRRRGDRFDLRVLGRLERQPRAASPRAERPPSSQRAPTRWTRRSPNDRFLYVNGGNTGDDQRLQDRRERLPDLGWQRRRPPAGFGGLVVSS